MNLFSRTAKILIVGLLAAATVLPAAAQTPSTCIVKAKETPDIAVADPGDPLIAGTPQSIALEPTDQPTPDSITAEGRRAIAEFYGIGPQPVSNTDSPKLGLPGLDDIVSVRLFHSGKLYLIDDPAQISRLWQAMEKINASPVTSRTEVTGYNAADYPEAYRVQLVYSSGNGTDLQTWCTISNSDRYLIRVNEHTDFVYDDLPFATDQLASLTTLLDELVGNQSKQSSVLSLVSDRPQIFRMDEDTLFFTTTDDLKNTEANQLYQAYQQLSPYRGQYTGGDSKTRYLLSGNGEQISLQPAQLGAKIFLDQRDYQANIFYFYGLDGQFLSRLDSATSDLPAHPLWFSPILSGQKLTVLDSAPSATSEPPVTVANLASADLLLPVLSSLTVQKDNIQKVDNNYFLKQPLTCYLRIDGRNYTMSINDSALLLRGKTEGYSILYRLVDGAKTKAAVEQAIKLTEANRLADAYSQMLLQLVKDEPGYFRKTEEITIHFQNSTLSQPVLTYLCNTIEEKLAKEGTKLPIFAGSRSQLQQDGKWAKHDGSDIEYYRDGVLIEINDQWDGDSKVTYSISAQTCGQDLVCYMENTASYQNKVWTITPSSLIAIA